jgi:hypothetical protein
MARKVKEVQRKIFFYRLRVQPDSNGNTPPFDLKQILSRIDGLNFDETQGRYLTAPDDNVYCCWVDKSNPSLRVRFAISRRNGLPRMERRGTVKNLPISPTSGLLEQIQAIFFPNNIVGADFNFYGPRLPKLADYLYLKAFDICPKIVFEPLLRQDVSDELSRLTDIRLLQLQIRPSDAQTRAAADQDLFSAFDAAASLGNATEVEITLKPPAHSRGHLDQGLLAKIRRFAGRSDMREITSRFIVKGMTSDTGRVEKLDFLNDHLVASENIMQQDARNRTLNPASAYEAIGKAYRELREELETAASLVA